MEDTNGGTVNVTMTPQNYIQADGKGNIYFAVQPQDTLAVVMGAMMFDTFYIVLDRSNHRIGFGPGCDCET
jgi:hypothetical protein